MDNLEKELFELNKNDFEIPEEVSNKINMAFDEIRRKKHILQQQVWHLRL